MYIYIVIEMIDGYDVYVKPQYYIGLCWVIIMTMHFFFIFFFYIQHIKWTITVVRQCVTKLTYSIYPVIYI